MRTVAHLRSFLSSIAQPKLTKNNELNLVPAYNHNANLTHEVRVFDDYPDVREALEELELAGLDLGKIKLIAGDAWRCHWLGDLIICDRFDGKLFESDRNTQDFFRQLFEQGKYLLLLTGTQNELNFAHQIIDCCQVCSEVWYF